MLQTLRGEELHVKGRTASCLPSRPDLRPSSGGWEEKRTWISYAPYSRTVLQRTKEVLAMSTTTQRLSSLLVATMFIVLLALMATFGVRSADAAQPVCECPTGYELVTVKYVVKMLLSRSPTRPWTGMGMDVPASSF